MKKGLFSTILLLMGVSGFSQSIVTDRPDQTEASSTVGRGILQIESGVTYMVSRPSMLNGKVENLSWNTLWRVGLADRFELRVVTQPEYGRLVGNGETQSEYGGLADLQLGFKVNILKAGEGHPEVGFLSHLVVPSGTDELSINGYGVINKLAVTHSLSQSHTLAWNIGYDYLGIGNGDLFYSLAWGVGLGDRLSIYFEPYGLLENMDDLVLNADAGFTYLLSDNIQFDYSFGVGISDEMNYHSIGLSLRLPE